MPHLSLVKPMLSGQNMATLSRGVIAAQSAPMAVQRPKTGATWTTRSGLIASAVSLMYAAGKHVVSTDSTAGYYSTNGGYSWTSFTAPFAFRHMAGNASGKWILLSSTFSTNTISVTTTTDFVTFATPFTINTGGTTYSQFGLPSADWDATINKFAFIIGGTGGAGKIFYSTSGDTGTWSSTTLNNTGNNYPSSLGMANGYAYIGMYGDSVIQYSTTLTSWTNANVGDAQSYGRCAINKVNGQFVHGSNYNVSGGNEPRYAYGTGSSISNTYFTNTGLYGSNFIVPNYIGNGGFLGTIPNATRGKSLVYSTDPTNGSSWTITDSPATGYFYGGADTDGWFLTGFFTGAPSTVYIALT